MQVMRTMLVELFYCLKCIIPGNGLAGEIGMLAPDETGCLVIDLLVLINESRGWPRDPRTYCSILLCFSAV